MAMAILAFRGTSSDKLMHPPYWWIVGDCGSANPSDINISKHPLGISCASWDGTGKLGGFISGMSTLFQGFLHKFALPRIRSEFYDRKCGHLVQKGQIHNLAGDFEGSTMFRHDPGKQNNCYMYVFIMLAPAFGVLWAQDPVQ